MKVGIKYVLIGFGLILNAASVYADNNVDSIIIPVVTNADFEMLATDAAKNNKRLMVIYYNKKCGVCDQLLNNNAINDLRRDYRVYSMNAAAGFEIVCPNGDNLSDKEFMEMKNITALPAVIITDKQGNVELVENSISSSKHIIDIGRRYKSNHTKKITTQTPVKSISWINLPKGRQISPVFGDMKKGHHVTFIKFPPGLKTKPHTHTNDYVGVVVKGEMRHFESGKPETKKLLQPGSTWSVPGNVVHISECSSKQECVFIIHQEQSFDRKVVTN